MGDGQELHEDFPERIPRFGKLNEGKIPFVIVDGLPHKYSTVRNANKKYYNLGFREREHACKICGRHTCCMKDNCK